MRIDENPSVFYSFPYFQQKSIYNPNDCHKSSNNKFVSYNKVYNICILKGRYLT